MSKAKKTILIVIAAIFGALVILNTVLLGAVIWTFNDMSGNFYSYFPFLQPSGSYYSVDDIGYIAVESALPDMDRVASGAETPIYSAEEISEIIANATAQRGD